MAPIVIKLSAILNTGKSYPKIIKSKKSITYPYIIRSIRLPTAPEIISNKEYSFPFQDTKSSSIIAGISNSKKSPNHF